jgi:hypothetical protein
MKEILKTIELSETEIQVIRIVLEAHLITFEGRGYVETLEALQLKFLELAQQTLPTPEQKEMLAASAAFLFR